MSGWYYGGGIEPFNRNTCGALPNEYPKTEEGYNRHLNDEKVGVLLEILVVIVLSGFFLVIPSFFIIWLITGSLLVTIGFSCLFIGFVAYKLVKPYPKREY